MSAPPSTPKDDELAELTRQLPDLIRRREKFRQELLRSFDGSVSPATLRWAESEANRWLAREVEAVHREVLTRRGARP